MNPGDLVEFLPKEYGTPGHPIKDQYVGLIGMIVSVHSPLSGINLELTILVTHPDDGYPSEIVASKTDVTVISTPDELTDEQLENVVGGRTDAAFERWRTKTINNHGCSSENQAQSLTLTI